MASVVNINEVVDGRVSLQVECVDRLYLNAYCSTRSTPPDLRAGALGCIGGIG
jgi:hypothetical protein